MSDRPSELDLLCWIRRSHHSDLLFIFILHRADCSVCFVTEPSHTSTSKGQARQRTHVSAPSRETLESESSHMQSTGTSQSQAGAPPVPALPTLAREPEDENPVFIQHQDGGSVPPPRAREIIELPPGYHQLPRPPPRQPRPLPQTQPQPQYGRDAIRGESK